jgi:hypothetical protein
MIFKLLPIAILATASGCAQNESKPLPVEEALVVVTQESYMQPSFTVKEEPVLPDVQNISKLKNWTVKEGDYLNDIFQKWAKENNWQLKWQGDYLQAEANLTIQEESLSEAIKKIIRATRARKTVEAFSEKGNQIILIQDGAL